MNYLNKLEWVTKATSKLQTDLLNIFPRINYVFARNGRSLCPNMAIDSCLSTFMFKNGKSIEFVVCEKCIVFFGAKQKKNLAHVAKNKSHTNRKTEKKPEDPELLCSIPKMVKVTIYDSQLNEA